MTILLVDDDKDDQDIFAEAVSIAKPGCKLLLANDGAHGFSVLQQEGKPDYIFLDINMPEINGKEFLQSLKSDPAYSEIPVVIYTTSSHKSELGEYFKMGATNFVTKPSEFNLLVTYLKSILH